MKESKEDAVDSEFSELDGHSSSASETEEVADKKNRKTAKKK